MALTRHTLFARCTHKLIDYSEPIRRFSLTTLASRLVSCSLNNVVIEDDGSVAVTASQEKWDRMKAICNYWLGVLEEGVVDLDQRN